MRNKLYTIIALLLIASVSVAQRQTSSPFSRYGYGDIYSPTNAYHQAMAGVSVGICNPVQINFSNAASQAFIRKETFLFNVELGGNFRKMKEEDASANSSTVGIESFSFAFPIIPERWGMAIGLLPFNSVGYEMNYQDSLSEYFYKGDGGMNQVVLSTGFKLFKGFAIGGNVAYIFGETNYTSENYFSESTSFYSRKDLEYQAKGFLWNVGIQYNYEFSENNSLTIGATYRNDQTISYDETKYFGSYITGGVTETQKDTVVLSTTENLSTDIPMELAMGLSYRTNNTWLFALDAGIQDWNKKSIYGTIDDNLKQTKFFKIGCEYVPDFRSTKYLKRMPIRMGLRYSELPIVYQYKGESHQALEMAISLGTQIRSKQTQNSLSIGFEGGFRGNTNLAKSLQETFLLCKLNVTLQESWFKKRKID